MGGGGDDGNTEFHFSYCSPPPLKQPFFGCCRFLNLFDQKFSACVSFSNKLLWHTIYEFFKLYSPFKIADRFFSQQGM